MAELATASPPQDTDFLSALEQLKALLTREQEGGGPVVTTQDIAAEMGRRGSSQAPQPLLPVQLPPLPSLAANRLAGSEVPPETLLGGEPRARRIAVPPLPFPREGVQNALMPQTDEERNDLGRDARSMGVLLEAIGAAPAYRAANAALEGRPIDAAGNAAVAAIPYRPLLGAGVLGAAYGGAIASDLGAFGPPPANAQPRSNSSNVMPGLTPQQQSDYDKLRLQLERGNFGSGAQRRQIEETMRELRRISSEFVRANQDASIASQTAKDQQAQQEYNRGVERAEAVRDAELARDRRFSETGTGRLFEQTGGLAPFAFGTLTGMLSRAATGASRPALYNYGLPIASGSLAGFSAAHVPLGYNALFTEPDNPQRRAYEAYGRELPAAHPRRQEFLDYARGLPTENPVRREAAEQLYDPVRFAERSGIGVIEGALGGLAGSELWRIPSRLLGRGSGNPQPSPQPTALPVETTGPVAPNRLGLAARLDTPANANPPNGPPPPPHTWNERAGRWQGPGGRFISGRRRPTDDAVD